jgi:hypothetical protein
MEIYLSRNNSGKEDWEKSTIGELIVNDTKVFTIEDDYDEQKEPGQTRIPAGRYEIKLRLEGSTHINYLKRFQDIHKGMLHLQNVPGFEYILIHCGNTSSDTKGCICVGSQKINGDYIAGSETAYRKIYPVIAGELVSGGKVFIKITD